VSDPERITPVLATIGADRHAAVDFMAKSRMVLERHLQPMLALPGLKMF